MGPISPIQGGADMASQIQGMTQALSGAGVQQSAAAQSMSMQSMSISSVHSSVSQMMQSTGLSAESQRMMAMLIATMVILAMLEQMQGGGEQGGGAARGSGGSATEYLSLMSMSYSSYSVEQSFTSITMTGAESFSAVSQAQPSTGGRIDVAA